MSTRTWLAADYYATLGVAPDATGAEIAQAFRAQAKHLHPDRADSPDDVEVFKMLADAYGVLSHPERRARYDALRRLGPEPAPPPEPARRPLSVQFLPTGRRARWAVCGGIGLLVAGVVACGVVAWLQASSAVQGPDATAQYLTFWLVAIKLVVVGIVFAALGHRRQRYP